MLKCDFHMHAREDPLDWCTYGVRDLIDKAAALKFDVLAITFHGHAFSDAALTAYARERGVLLISGCEVFVGRKEVLCLNITQDEVKHLHSFADVRAWKKAKGEQGLVIAPHPFYPLDQCLREEFEANVDLWDAVEYCHMHIRGLNFNRAAVRAAAAHGLPLVANSDAHELFMFGRNYTLVDAEKDMLSLFRAIRAGKTQYHAPPLSLWEATKTAGVMSFRHGFARWFSARHRAAWLAKKRRHREMKRAQKQGRLTKSNQG